MRARIAPGYTVLTPDGRLFPAGVWFDAGWTDERHDEVELHHGSMSVIRRVAEVEIRAAGDDEWEILGFPPFRELRPGEPVPYVTPIVECPYGHRGHMPQALVGRSGTLTCPECGRDYVLPEWE